MAKGISTGIEHLITQKKKDEKKSIALSKQWKDIRNKIDSILLSGNIMKTSELRQRCFALDGMTTEGRSIHITKHWGQLYLEKVQPLLQQLEAIEKQLPPEKS